MPKAPNKKRVSFSFPVELSFGANHPMIQNAAAANVHRSVAPVRGLIQNDIRYLSAFMFRPLNIFEMTMLMLASVFLFFMNSVLG